MADGPVDWQLAERVAVRAAGREPFADSYLAHSLQADFDEATAEAEELVAQATGLRSLSGPARARVTDRAGWVHANVASFQRLLRPLTDQARRDALGNGPAVRGRPHGRRRRGRHAARLDVGRVLGQYDLLVVEDPAEAVPGGPGPRVLRRPERARPREALRVPAEGVPPVARAPRGHPPGAVHRRPVDAGALPRAGRADAGLARPRPEAVLRRAHQGRRRPARRVASRSTTVASPRCSPRPSSAWCSTRSAGS